MYHVTLKEFEGPLDLLLQLIEKEKFDISTVSLANITEQYLGYIEDIEKSNVKNIIDFLVVASQLLLIKSQLLLPDLHQHNDEDGSDLEFRLKELQRFRQAGKQFRTMMRTGFRSFERHVPLETKQTFSKPSNVNPRALFVSFQRLASVVEKTVLPEKTIQTRISIKDQITYIQRCLSKLKKSNFTSLLSKDQGVIGYIVTFLALLELIKQETVVVSQKNNFSDIKLYARL